MALVVSAAAVVGVKAYNYYSMPALMRANLEALANLEGPYNRVECYSKYSKCVLWGCVLIYKCGDCEQVKADNNENLGGKSICYNQVI